MNVLKIVIVSFIFLNASFLYTPFNLQGVKEKITIKKFKDLKSIDFNNSIAVINYNYLPLILNSDLVIVSGFGKVKKKILTNKKFLNKIHTIANLELESKILLSRINSDLKEKNATFKDFLEQTIDAIVVDDKVNINDVFSFRLKDYGLEFPEYFVITSRNFINRNGNLVNKINRYFENNFDFNKERIYNSILITSFYLNKKINFNKILFNDYNSKKTQIKLPLIIGLTHNWSPFHMYKDGEFYGIGIDFWRLIAKKANLNYKFKVIDYWSDVLKSIKEKKIDLTVDTSETKDRKEYAVFSKPYISFPLGIICRNDKNYNTIKDIKSLAVGKNFTAEKLMRKYYPDLNYIEVKSTYDALMLVTKSKVDCAVDILPVILWNINKEHLMNLQLAFKTPFKFNVQIMLNKDKAYLIPKINKAIDKITLREKEKITNLYMNTLLIKKTSFNWKFVIGLLILGLIFVAIMLYKIAYLSKKANYDPLTKILNRRGVTDELNSKEGVILYLDIDHFKKINDTYGHDKGDEVLKKLGEILKTSFRRSDIVGRWGGEEFIVILKNSDYDNGIELAERLRKRVEESDFNGINVTISIGVSKFENEKEFEKAIKKADEALYEAKNNGRNQVKGKK